jgi:hypothetical protein
VISPESDEECTLEDDEGTTKSFPEWSLPLSPSCSMCYPCKTPTPTACDIADEKVTEKIQRRMRKNMFTRSIPTVNREELLVASIPSCFAGHVKKKTLLVLSLSTFMLDSFNSDMWIMVQWRRASRVCRPFTSRRSGRIWTRSRSSPVRSANHQRAPSRSCDLDLRQHWMATRAISQRPSTINMIGISSGVKRDL